MSWLGHDSSQLFFVEKSSRTVTTVFCNSGFQVPNNTVELSLTVHFPKVKHAAFLGAILGAVGPLLYYVSEVTRDFILGNGLFLWPTGLIIIVTYGHEHDFFGYAVTAISIVLNIGLYAAAVMFLWFLIWIVRRVTMAKR